MNLFFWRRRPDTQVVGFRTQLESLSRELRLRLGDVSDSTQARELLAELNTVESNYKNSLQELHRRTS